MPTTQIKLGPLHCGTHGVLDLTVEASGGIVKSVDPHVGLSHRGVEKLVESRLYMQSPSYMERLDYVAPFSWDDLFVSAVEEATGIEVGERAQYARMVLLELERIASHLFWLGTFCNDIGLPKAEAWAFGDRKRVTNFLEHVAGSRMFYLNLRLGGFDRDLPLDFKEMGSAIADYIEDRVHWYRTLLEDDPVFLERTRNMGTLKYADAIDAGVSGPVLRGSGIEEDTRRSKPYYFYDQVKFTVPIQSRADCLGRYRVRMEEIHQSAKIISRVLEIMPDIGEVKGLPIRLAGPNANTEPVIVSRELPRGEGLIYMVPGRQKPRRISLRSPSFSNLSALSKVCEGARLADVFAILSSLDIVISEVDR
jgi:NADH-quinone oxidoreductase subunit D